MSKKSICIISGGHLCTNPRVVKEANFLNDLRFNVTILTIWKDKRYVEEDRKLIAATIRYIGVDLCNRRSMRFWINRFKRKIGSLLVRNFDIQSVHALSYGLSELLFLAYRVSPDLFIVHQECGLYVGTKLLNEGRKVAFDFEDWHSEDLPLEHRKERPVRALKRMERMAMEHGVYITTTSAAMANAMVEYYSGQKPTVVRNTFNSILAQSDPLPYDPHSKIRLIWFSQTIGPERGLELLAEALRQIPAIEIEIHLLGSLGKGYQKQLKSLFPDSIVHRLFIHATVSNAELPFFLTKFDVGLALENKSSRNRDLTITNKILQYFQAGIPVIATRTAGQEEVAGKALGAVFMVEQDDAAGLANCIASLNENRAALSLARAASREIGLTTFNWQKESLALKQVLQKNNLYDPACVSS